MNLLEAELDNLRALMAWARARDDKAVTALTLAAALADWWGSTQGHMIETLSWVEEALARGDAAPAVLRAKALNGLLRMRMFGGYNLVRWAEQAEQSLVRSAQVGDPYERVESLWYAFHAQWGLWKKLALWIQPPQWDSNSYIKRMEGFAEDTLALSQRLQYSHGITCGFMLHGDVQFLWADQATALRYYEPGLREARETDNVDAALGVIHRMSRVAPMCALAECEHEVARQRELGERISLALALRSLGGHVAGGGDFVRAQSLLQEGLALRLRLNVRWSVDGGKGTHYSDLGSIAWLQGNYPEALTQLQYAFDAFQEAAELILMAQIHLVAGLAHLNTGDLAHASSHLQRSFSMCRESDRFEMIPYGLAALGMLAEAHGDAVRAGRLMGAGMMLRDRTLKWQWSTVLAAKVYEKVVTTAVCLRDDPAIAAAWREGQQMSPDKAVEYALLEGTRVAHQFGE